MVQNVNAMNKKTQSYVVDILFQVWRDSTEVTS